jgi:signal transduction histidine kinase
VSISTWVWGWSDRIALSKANRVRRLDEAIVEVHRDALPLVEMCECEGLLRTLPPALELEGDVSEQQHQTARPTAVTDRALTYSTGKLLPSFRQKTSPSADVVGWPVRNGPHARQSSSWQARAVCSGVMDQFVSPTPEELVRGVPQHQLKSEFLANVSHESRTPLNGIIGYADLLYHGKVGPLVERHKTFLGYVPTSSRHLLQLINDILDLANVEAGRLEFQPEPVNLPPAHRGSAR